MLRAEANDLAAPRHGLKREFHYQPLLRPERPIGAIPRDLGIVPAVMPLGLRQLDRCNTFGRIIFAHGRNGMSYQSANGLQPRPLCARARDLAEHFHNVFAAQQPHALAAVLGTEFLDDATAGASRVGCPLWPTHSVG